MRTLIDVLTTDTRTLANVQCVGTTVRDSHSMKWRYNSDTTHLTEDVIACLKTFLSENGIDNPDMATAFLGTGDISSRELGRFPLPGTQQILDDPELQWAYALMYNGQEHEAQKLSPEETPELFASVINIVTHIDPSALPGWVACGLASNRHTPATALASLATRSDVEGFAHSLMSHERLDDEVAISLVAAVPAVAENLARNSSLGSAALAACIAAIDPRGKAGGSIPWSIMSSFRRTAPYLISHANVTPGIIDELAAIIQQHLDLLDDHIFASLASSPATSTDTLTAILEACERSGNKAPHSLQGSCALMGAANATPQMRASALNRMAQTLNNRYLSSYELNQAAQFISRAKSIPLTSWRLLMDNKRAEVRCAAAIVTSPAQFEELLERGKPAAIVAAFCQNERFRDWLATHPTAKTRARCVTLAAGAEDSRYVTDSTPKPESYLDSDDEVLRAAAVRTVDDPALLMTLVADSSARVRDAVGRRLGKALVAA